MQPSERDAGYLWDMLDSARTVRDFVAGVRFEEFKQTHSEIPWGRIIAQRNVLAHEYGEIKQERMWLVATVHVPALIPQLEALIPPLPPQA